MKKLWRYSGKLLLYTGILHTLVGIIFAKDGFIKIYREEPSDLEEDIKFWFLFCGIVIILFGLVLDHYIKQTQKPAPAFLGWSLFIISAIGCLIIPVSGFWLFLPQAFIIIMANQRK